MSIVEGLKVYEGTIKNYLGIPDDEPIFILRAQDVEAMEIVHYYSDNYRTGGTSKEFLRSLDEKVNEWETWRDKNQDVLKRAD